jgi:hypothetical protein
VKIRSHPENHADECSSNRRPGPPKKGLKSNSLGGAGKRHSP